MSKSTSQICPEQELVATRTVEKLTLAKSLSDAFGLTRLLIHQEVLLPGRAPSGFHRHSEEEELFYVLSGQPSVCVGEEITDLAPGDVIGFKPASEPQCCLTVRKRLRSFDHRDKPEGGRYHLLRSKYGLFVG